MIAEYGFTIVLSVFLVYSLGLLLLSALLAQLARWVLHFVLTTFKLYDEFRAFILAKYRPKKKALRPQINDKEDA